MAGSRDRKIAAIKKRIVPVADAEPYLNMLVYGPNKKGKTRFAATAPKLLIADIDEKGTKSIRHSSAAVFHARAWEDIVYLYWFLKGGKHDYESFAVDTLTGLQDMCMKHVLKEAEDRDPNRDPALASMREWGKVGLLIKPLLLNLRNLPMHTIFIAQERIIGEDEDDMHVPDLSPSVRVRAMASVDVIGRIYQGQTRTVDKKRKKEVKTWETRMLVGPHEEYITGDRSGNLPRIVRQPTIEKVLAAFNKED
jgi:hypothetical protein